MQGYFEMMTVSLDSMVDSFFYVKKSSSHGVVPDMLPPKPEPLDNTENKPLSEQSVMNQPVEDSTHEDDDDVEDGKTCSSPPSDGQPELLPQDDMFEKDTSPTQQQDDDTDSIQRPPQDDGTDSIQRPPCSSISSSNFDPYEKPEDDEDTTDGSLINLLHGKKDSHKEPEMIPMQDLADLPDNQCAITIISRRSRHRAGTVSLLNGLLLLSQSGTRYRRRGINPTGAVANFVETEQVHLHFVYKVWQQ